MPTRFELHRADWADCQRCSYAGHRANVCLVRGKIPADVLFVGQAPGISENATGLPFEGPAGNLLLGVVDRGLAGVVLCADCLTPQFDSPSGETCKNGHGGADGRPVRVAYTNLVGCIPPADEYGKEGEPDHDAIEACRPRLQEIIDIINPRLVVRVGAYAKKWVNPGYKASVKLPDGCKVADLDHPASVLRVNVAQRGLLLQRMEVTLSQAVEEL